MSELVILLDDDGVPIGTAPKSTVHTTETPLHLAFSCHVTRSDGRILVTRRALSKLPCPGVGTNSCCGRPAPDEPIEGAVARRALRKLGIRIRDLEPILPDFRYRAIDASGIVEHEVCPVFTATTDDEIAPAPDEVAEFAWITPDELRAAVRAAPFAFSPWLALQLQQFETELETADGR